MTADASAAEALSLARDGVDALAEVDLRDLAGESMSTLLDGLEALGRRLGSIRSRLLAALEADGQWAVDGSRSFSSWLRRATGASSGQAWRETKTARALRAHLPGAAEALGNGLIGIEHAHLLAAHTTGTPERLAALAHPQIGEAFLVETATRMDASDFAKVVRAWAIAADPAGADADHAEAADRQELVLAKTLHGYHLQGWLTDVDGAALDAALNALIGTPDRTDGRTTAQRRAGALVGLARTALDGGLPAPGASIRPHLTVHVPHETLEALLSAQDPGPIPEPGTRPSTRPQVLMESEGCDSEGVDSERSDDGQPPARPLDCPPSAADHGSEGGDVADHEAPPDTVIPGSLDHTALIGVAPAELDDGTPLPPAVLARLACDSELARVVFGPAGEVLDVGRAQRLFPPGQRRAVIARDRHCQFPGCDAPPAHGEIHHSLWWYAHHGRTSVSNGILLCWYHHDYVHTHRITISRMGGTAVSTAAPGSTPDCAPGSGTGSGTVPAPECVAADAAPTWTFTRPNGHVIRARDAHGRRARNARGTTHGGSRGNAYEDTRGDTSGDRRAGSRGNARGDLRGNAYEDTRGDTSGDTRGDPGG